MERHTPVLGLTLTPEQIAKRALPAIVTIRGDEAMGSGFVVRSDGWIATNVHVLQGQPQVHVVTADGVDHQDPLLIAFDGKRDLAVISIAGTGLTALPLAENAAARPGQSIVAIGHPLGLEDTVSNGLISAVREVDADFKLLQISAPIDHGSSGGPIIRDDGAVLGISVSGIEKGHDLNFAVPVDYLRELLTHTGKHDFSELPLPGAQH